MKPTTRTGKILIDKFKSIQNAKDFEKILNIIGEELLKRDLIIIELRDSLSSTLGQENIDKMIKKWEIG